MTKTISDILEVTEPLFSLNIEQLERASGRPNVDIHLTSEMILRACQANRELGLDPQDTTDEELYHALRNLVQTHDRFITRYLGGQDPDDVTDMMPRVLRMVKRLDIPRSGWFLKPSIAKKLLKASSPQKVMKALGYRSVDSMIKHEPIAAVFAAARVLENQHWLENFLTKYHKLTPSDFEIRDIEIIALDNSRWAKVADAVIREKHHNVMDVKELGAIIVMPLPVKSLPGLTTTLTLMVLQMIHEIRLYSAYWKLHQVQPNFGKRLASGLVSDEGYHAQLLGHKIHWRILQRHYGHQKQHFHPETFEPHLQAEDLVWHKAEETLYHLEPALYFWYNKDYVAVMGEDGKPISFNLLDAALNYMNQLPFEKRSYRHAVAGLWNELYGRYLRQSAVEEQVLKQFDGTLFDEDVPLSIHLKRRMA